MKKRYLIPVIGIFIMGETIKGIRWWDRLESTYHIIFATYHALFIFIIPFLLYEYFHS